MEDNFSLKKFVLITLITSVWIHASEIFRYIVFVIPKTKLFFNDKIGVFDSNLTSSFIWFFWDIFLTAILVLFFWLFAKYFGNNLKSIFVSATVVWITVFVLFWVATANMGLSDWSILWITLYLSWIEMIIGAWIVSKLYKKKQMSKSKIVDIPVKMEKFYGKGSMLHPAIEDIEALVKTIPIGAIATIETLCQKLAVNFGTNVTCPMRTGNAIKKISENYFAHQNDKTVPFWRVVRKDSMLIKSKVYEFCAARIEDEGFSLSYTKSGAIKVHFNSEVLFRF